MQTYMTYTHTYNICICYIDIDIAIDISKCTDTSTHTAQFCRGRFPPLCVYLFGVLTDEQNVGFWMSGYTAIGSLGPNFAATSYLEVLRMNFQAHSPNRVRLEILDCQQTMQ